MSRRRKCLGACTHRALQAIENAIENLRGMRNREEDVEGPKAVLCVLLMEARVTELETGAPLFEVSLTPKRHWPFRSLHCYLTFFFQAHLLYILDLCVVIALVALSLADLIYGYLFRPSDSYTRILAFVSFTLHLAVLRSDTMHPMDICTPVC